MTETPTLDLAELKRLEKAATPGPWYDAAGPSKIVHDWDNDGYAVVADSPCPRSPSTGARAKQWDADRRAIVALRNAAPALIAAAKERDELRAERDALRVEVEEQRALVLRERDEWAASVAAYNRLSAERDALRAKCVADPKDEGDKPALGARDYAEQWARDTLSGARWRRSLPLESEKHRPRVPEYTDRTRLSADASRQGGEGDGEDRSRDRNRP